MNGDLDAQDVPEQIVGLVVFSFLSKDGAYALYDWCNIGVVHAVCVSVEPQGFPVEHHGTVEVSLFVVSAS